MGVALHDCGTSASFGVLGIRMNSLVSIIIPCYNGEGFVGEAIGSALAQTYPHTEVIVIDDGSTDGSLDVIKSFGDRIRWETGPNRGGSAARNRGLDLAQGELVQFLDADDLLYPYKLEWQVPLMVKRKADMVFCDWESVPFGQPEPVQRHRLEFDNEGDDPVIFCLRSHLPTSSPIHWKKNLQKVGGFDEDLPCAQERDLHLRLACAGLSFNHLPEVLYRVRSRREGVSSDYLRVLDQRLPIFLRNLDRLDARKKLTERRLEAFAAALARDARRYAERGRSARARECFGLARRIHARGALGVYHPVLRPFARCLNPCLAENISMMRALITRAVRRIL